MKGEGQGLDSPDIVYYCTDQTIFQRLRTPQKVLTAKRPHYSSFGAKMSPPTTFPCVEHHADKVMNEPHSRMAFPTS